METLNYNFNNTLEEMNKAGYLSQEFLEIVQPDIEAALNETTTELIVCISYHGALIGWLPFHFKGQRHGSP